MVIFARFFRHRPIGENAFLSLCSGLGICTTVFYILAVFGLVQFAWIWIAGSPVAALILLPGIKECFSDKRLSGDGNARYMFWGLLAVVAAAYAIPVFSTDYPLGLDPTFHCILIQKILNSGSLAANLHPFEDITVNYSQGMHVFLAVLAKLSGQPPHLVFQTMHLPLMVAYSAGVYLLAVRIFRNALVGFWAMLIFAFVDGFFFSVYQWGGMPTEMSGLLGLGFLLCILGLRRRLEYVCAILICGAMLLTHHLTVFIYFVSIGFFLTVSFLAQRKLTGSPKDLLLSASEH